MDEVTERWGVKVSQVEINEIDPPPGVKAAMEREKSAEAIKTAEITESEGQRQAQINRAEGEKQSAILQAEGQRQSEILQAEGDQQAAILRAEGFSGALDRIYRVANTVDAKTMSLQYFDTLKSLGESPSTKWIFPMEFTSMLSPFLGMGGNQGQGDGGKRQDLERLKWAFAKRWGSRKCEAERSFRDGGTPASLFGPGLARGRPSTG